MLLSKKSDVYRLKSRVWIAGGKGVRGRSGGKTQEEVSLSERGTLRGDASRALFLPPEKEAKEETPLPRLQFLPVVSRIPVQPLPQPAGPSESQPLRKQMRDRNRSRLIM